MLSIRLLRPHVVSRTNKRSPNKNTIKPKLDVKRFKEEVGIHFNTIQGTSISENRYKFFTDEEKQHRKDQVQQRRINNPAVRKQESVDELIRVHKRLGKLRTCSKCDREKTWAEFDRKYEKRLKRHVLRSYCTECRKVMNRLDYLRRRDNNDT